MSEFETIEEYQQSIKMFKADCIKGFEVVVLSSDNDRAKLQLRLTPYTDKKCGYGCHDLDFGLSIYQHQQAKINELQKRIDELEWFAKSIRNWDAHPKDLEINNGSWGVRDFYRNYADNVLKGESNE